MTGHSLAEIILSPERIDYTAIDEPDYFIVISEDGLKRAWTRIEKLPDTCTIYAEESLELPETKAKIVRLPLIETAKKISKLSIAVVALAAVLAETELFPVEAFETAISTFQKAKIAEINVKAAAAGAGMAST
jgi:Pyruvate/2-oxoacid:ferredoxin oxidoreductase gamma subunit